MHTPVMSREVMEFLAVRPDGHYLDCTAGLGGHTALIAQQLTTGFVIANDRDAESLEKARLSTAAWSRSIRYHHGRFSELEQAVAGCGTLQPGCGALKLDGLLADLGVSRYQLTAPERGFSLQASGPVDMRMDREQETTAADLVNHYAEKALADLIYQFGEERRSRRIARAIVRARPIRDTGHLARVIEEAVPRTGRLHPATQTFMALRMAVNAELEELDALLEVAPKLMAPGGRIVIITFTSLEDRKVKQSFQRLAAEDRARILTRHVVKPSEEEVSGNAASRSAKLRAVEMAMEQAA